MVSHTQAVKPEIDLSWVNVEVIHYRYIQA